MSDREQAGLRGPVKTCIEESTFPNQAVMRTTMEYRPDGKSVETRFDHGDGFAWVSAREYDSDGRLIKIKPVNSDHPNSETICVYDDAGRSLSVTNTLNGDRTDFHYDNGRKVGIQRFDPETLQRARKTAYGVSAWEAATCGAGIPFGGTIATIYDEEDRPIEMQTCDANGQTITRFIRTYNASGLVIEEKPIMENGNPAALFLEGIPAEGQDKPTEAQLQAFNKALKTLMTGRVETGTWHTYDAQNRITSVREANFVFERTTEITYNEHGDKAEERTTVSGNSLRPIGVAFSIQDDGTLVQSQADAPLPETPFDSIPPTVVRHAYQYDDHGNWTQRTSNHSTAGGDNPNSVSRRTITYY